MLIQGPSLTAPPPHTQTKFGGTVTVTNPLKGFVLFSALSVTSHMLGNPLVKPYAETIAVQKAAVQVCDDRPASDKDCIELRQAVDDLQHYDTGFGHALGETVGKTAYGISLLSYAGALACLAALFGQGPFARKPQ